MTARLRPLLAVALLTTACEAGGRPPAFVILGPSVPSPLLPATLYVWDTREELGTWVVNAVSRGSLAVEGSGTDAFVRIDRADREWVLRGPDLDPPAAGVQTLSVRYRWRPDPGLPPTAARTARITAQFQTTTPVVAYDRTAQAAASATLEPRDEWTVHRFVPGNFAPPIDVSYCYLHSYGANRGVIEIDRIELIR